MAFSFSLIEQSMSNLPTLQAKHRRDKLSDRLANLFPLLGVKAFPKQLGIQKSVEIFKLATLHF